MAGPVIWGPSDASGNSVANNLESGIGFANGSGARILSPATPVDPTSVATFGNPGDLYISNTGLHYIKQDSGTTTNWSKVAIGTSMTNPMTTLGDMIYENATPAPARLAGNTTSTLNVLTQTGTGSVSAAPAWLTLPAAFGTQTANTIFAGPASGAAANPSFRALVAADISLTFTAPTLTEILSSSTTGGNIYMNPNVLLTVTAGSASRGDVYHDGSGNVGTIIGTIGSIIAVHMTTGTGFNSSPITKTSGSGTTTISFSAQNGASGSGLYAPPSGTLYLRIRMIGPGGGGGGSGTAGTAGSGGNGSGATTFGTSMLSAGAGQGGGTAANTGGTGGTNSLGSVSGFQRTGSTGGGSQGIGTATTNQFVSGGMGGASMISGAGACTINSVGGSAIANTGSGGAGGGDSTNNNVYSGTGGGSGGCIFDAIIPTPSAYYPFSIGTGGIAGTAGTNGFAGGAGADGFIEIMECSQ